jgi:hypothetical protein
MSNLTEIKDFDVLAGTEIKEAVKEAIVVANHNGCIVKFMFNSVQMEIYYFSNLEEKIDYYYKKLRSQTEE